MCRRGCRANVEGVIAVGCFLASGRYADAAVTLVVAGLIAMLHLLASFVFVCSVFYTA